MSLLVTVGNSAPLGERKGSTPSIATSSVSTEELAIVPILPDGAREKIEGRSEPSQDAPADQTNETKSYTKFWNNTKWFLKEGSVFCTCLGKRALLNTVSTAATLWFDYKTEVAQQRKFISETTKSWHLDLIVNGGVNKAIDPLISFIESQKFYFKDDIVSFIKDNREFFKQILEVTVLRTITIVIQNVQKDWDNFIESEVEKRATENGFSGDETFLRETKENLKQEHPFSTFLVSSLLVRYNTFFKDNDGNPPKISYERQKQIQSLGSVENQIEAWKAEFGVPFVTEIIEKFLPDQTAILPVGSLTSSLIRKRILPRILPAIIEFCGGYLGRMKEIMNNPAEGRGDITVKKNFVESFQGGKELLGQLKATLDSIFTKLPNLVNQLAVPLAGQKASEFIIGGLKETVEEFNDPDHAKSLQNSMKNWIMERARGALSKKENIDSVVPFIKNELQHYITGLIESLLKRSGLSPESLANAQSTVSLELNKKVVSFLEKYKDELLQFEASLTGEEEKKRIELINKKYAPLCKEFLDSFQNKDKLAIGKIIINFLPVWLHAIFVAVQKPIEERQQAVTEIVAMATGDLDAQLQGTVAANKHFVDDATAALSSYLRSTSREQLESSERIILKSLRKFAEKKRIEFDADYENATKKALKWFIDPNSQGLQASAWNKIEELIQVALLQGTKRLFINSSLDLDANPENEEVMQTDLGNVFVLLMKILNESADEIIPQRQAELNNHQTILKALTSALTSAQERESLGEVAELLIAIDNEEARHSEALGAIFLPFIQKFMGGLSLKDKKAVVSLLPKELHEVGEPIVSMLWDEMIPQICGKMFEKTFYLSDTRKQLKTDVANLYSNSIPTLFAHVQALYLKAWLPKFLAKEVEKAKQPHPNGNNEEDAPATIVDKVIEGIAKFYRSKGAKIANLDKTTGQRVADFIDNNKEKLTIELAKALEKTGQKATFDKALEAGVDYVEGFLLQIFKGLYPNIMDMPSQTRVDLLKGWVGGLSQRLHTANDGVPDSTVLTDALGVAVPQTRRLLDRITASFGMDSRTAPIPDQGRKAIWEMLNDTVLPNAFSTLVSKFVNEQTLKKLILTSLEAYNAKDAKKQKIKDDLYEQYESMRRQAIQDRKPLPDRSILVDAELRRAQSTSVASAARAIPAENPNPNEAHIAELALVFGELLNEFAIATGDPVIRMLFTLQTVHESVSKTIAKLAYENITGEKIMEHTFAGLEAALGNLNLAVEENGELRTLKKIKIVTDGPYNAFITDLETNARVTSYKFNLEERAALPLVVQNQAGDDGKVSQSLFNYTTISSYITGFFSEVIISKPLSESEKINQLLSDIGISYLKSNVKDKLLSYWDSFQHSFYTQLKKIPFVGNDLARWKLKLDDFCWAVFSFTIGKILLVLAKGAKAIYSQRIMVLQTRVLEKFNAVFNERTLSQLGYSTLDALERSGE